MQQKIAVKWRNPDELTPYAHNPRAHTDKQIDEIAASIQQFGWTVPILIDEGGEIIAGHARQLAALRVGAAKVPTITLAGLTDAQKKAYVIADNKLTVNSYWDNDVLARQFQELLDVDFDLSVTGFNDAEISYLLPDSLGEEVSGSFLSDLPGFDTVAFRFGDYSAQVSTETYAKYKALFKESPGQDMVEDVLKRLVTPKNGGGADA